jgi:peptidoglycan/xylan/chitin deacetylase (PgdA/CDA1 family)
MQRRTFLGALGVGGAMAATGIATAEVSAHAAQSTGDDAGYGGTQRGSCRVVWSVETDKKVVALTFDDGPNPRYTPQVLKILATRQTAATFFVIGVNAERHQDLLKAAVAAGHEIGNHSLSHRTLMDHSAATIAAEIRQGAEIIERIAGTRPRWFRAPRGRLAGSALAAAASLGQDVAMWSMTRGGPDVADDDSDAVLAGLLATLHPGAIVDLHDGVGADDRGKASLRTRRDAEIRALGPFIEGARRDGYEFVTLTALVNRERSSIPS